MDTTTAVALKTAFIPLIKGIDPTYTKYQSKWRYLPNPEHIPGSAMRTFSLTFGQAEPDFGEAGLWNAGFSYTLLMRVETSYHHLPFEEEELVTQEDTADLFFTLSAAIPTITGLIDVEHGEFIPDGRSEDGSVFGAHEMIIRFFRRDR